ncbi:MAG TPA: TonB-dependent receptor [Sphingomonas sp.]|nr:TonB-dependent receptor [Sphingomonas sp.]
MTKQASRVRAGACVSAIALAVTAGGAAHAQTTAAGTAQAPQSSTESQPNQLEDIVVTAERREQSLQDVPISATVFNSADLERKGVADVADIQMVAPSVAINTYNRSTFINIRGVGIAQSAPTSNPGVAFYLNGALIPHEQFIGQSFYDIESIEVLRGPQGTLTGQNSTGGAVYVRTRAPDFDAFSGYVDATYGNYDHLKLMGALNAPVSDQFAIRVAGIHDERDSFTRNIGPSPSDPGNNDLWAGRVSVALRSPGETLRGAFHVDYFDQKTDNNAVKRRGDTVSTDPFVIEEDARSFQNQKGGKLSGEVKVALTPGIDLRTLVAYQNLHTIDQTDGDRTATALPAPAGKGRVSRVSTDIDTFMGEVNLLSTGNGPLNWVVGAFYLDETVDVLSLRDQAHTDDFYSSNRSFKTSANNTSKSLFGQINWFAAPPLELVAGVRYSDDRQVYNRIIPAGPTPPGADLVGVQHSTEWTGKLAVNYHFGDHLFYVSAAKGYKQGGVNLTLETPNFGPETNRVYEAGLKTQWFDNRLRVNGDVFYSQYRDIQLSSLLGGLPITQNAARGKAYGAELEITGVFGGLMVNAGGGYLHARFDGDSCITDTNAPGTDAGCDTGLRLVPDGRVLPFSPEWTINAGVQYEIPLGSDGSSLTPRLQWARLSKQYATPFPSFNTLVPKRDVLDARLTLDLDQGYTIEGFVQNLTDERYIASQIQDSSSADGGIIYGAPRTYGVRLVAKF